MIFNSGWSRSEIESLTYQELFEYVRIFYRQQAERDFNLFKAFCFYNAESSAVSQSSERSAMSKYARDIKNRKMSTVEKEINIDDQFEGLDFGQ